MRPKWIGAPSLPRARWRPPPPSLLSLRRPGGRHRPPGGRLLNEAGATGVGRNGHPSGHHDGTAHERPSVEHLRAQVHRHGTVDDSTAATPAGDGNRGGVSGPCGWGGILQRSEHRRSLARHPSPGRNLPGLRCRLSARRLRCSVRHRQPGVHLPVPWGRSSTRKREWLRSARRLPDCLVSSRRRVRRSALRHLSSGVR